MIKESSFSGGTKRRAGREREAEESQDSGDPASFTKEGHTNKKEETETNIARYDICRKVTKLYSVDGAFFLTLLL